MVQGPLDPLSLSSRKSFEPELILISAGEFLMGSDPRKDSCAQEREQPQHRLQLTDYCIGRTQVTNAQYAVFTQESGHRAPAHWSDGHPPRDKADHPVVNVTFFDALAYCRWLARVTGRKYCLPSEAEWEKAARGDDGRVYPWGDDWDPARCNAKESRVGDTTAVGVYREGASPYGVLDMAGNVFEWTRSLWGADMKEPEFGYPYDPFDGREELQAGNRVLRVLRGGGFYYNFVYARATYRVRSYPDYRVRTRGFRVAIAPNEITSYIQQGTGNDTQTGSS